MTTERTGSDLAKVIPLWQEDRPEGLTAMIDSMADEDITDLIDRIRFGLDRIKLLEAEAERLLAERMEVDRQIVGEYEIERTRTPQFEWDREAAYSDIRTKIIHRYCFNPTTGEIDRLLERAVTGAVDDILKVRGTGDPLVGGLKGLSLDAANYRQRKGFGRWRIKLGRKPIEKGAST